MRRPSRCSRTAFTLIEVLLASVAATTLRLTLMMSLMGSFDGFSTITAQAVLQTELDQALDSIVRDTKEARQAVSTYSVFSMDTKGGGTDGDACWILEVPSINAAGDTLNAPSAAYQDHIVYYYEVAYKRLRRIVDIVPGTSRPDPAPYPGHIIANNVEFIEFKLPPPLIDPADMRTKMVDVRIQGVSTQRGRAYRFSMTKQAVYRSPAPP